MKTKKTEDFKEVICSPIKVNVTEDDIAMGVPRNEEHCPIALALDRSLKNLVEGQISVQSTFVSIKRTGEECDLSVRLPAKAIDFISNFDDREPVEAFEFEIDGTKFGKNSKII